MVRNVFKPTDGRGVLVLLGVIFGGVTLILVLIAAGLVLRTWSFLGNAESATGTVVALTPRQTCSDNDNDKNRMSCSTVYAPLVRFTTADGREIEYQSSTATSPPSHRVGDQVEVLYLPDDPYRARVDSWVDLWLAPTIVGGIGGIFGIVAVALAGIGWAVSRPSAPAPNAEPRRPEAPKEPGGWQDPGTLR